MSYVIRYSKPVTTKVRLNNIFAISSFQGQWESAEEVVNAEGGAISPCRDDADGAPDTR
jgi:hypothetical protein